MAEICVGLSVGECRRIHETRCPGKGKCNFFQTKEQEEKSREKTFARLNSLSKIEQQSIAEKYYNGKMPWTK